MCQLATPAQIACAECSGCARVAGELRSRRAAEINLTINYALNVDMSCSREALVQLQSSRACHAIGCEAAQSVRMRRMQRIGCSWRRR